MCPLFFVEKQAFEDSDTGRTEHGAMQTVTHKRSRMTDKGGPGTEMWRETLRHRLRREDRQRRTQTQGNRHQEKRTWRDTRRP